MDEEPQMSLAQMLGGGGFGQQVQGGLQGLLNSLMPSAQAQQKTQQPPVFAIISPQHGPIGYFTNRQQAADHAKMLGVPIGPGNYSIKMMPVGR